MTSHNKVLVIKYIPLLAGAFGQAPATIRYHAYKTCTNSDRAISLYTRIIRICNTNRAPGGRALRARIVVYNVYQLTLLV